MLRKMFSAILKTITVVMKTQNIPTLMQYRLFILFKICVNVCQYVNIIITIDQFNANTKLLFSFIKIICFYSIKHNA